MSGRKMRASNERPVLRLLDNEFTIHRFPPDAPVPSSVFEGSFYWLGRTDEELSIVCDSSIRLVGGVKNAGWSCFQALGPIELSAFGVLAGMATVLASARISILALSTFDTDYFLVKTGKLQQAVLALVEAGYDVQNGQHVGRAR
jgi:hypothetical protein